MILMNTLSWKRYTEHSVTAFLLIDATLGPSMTLFTLKLLNLGAYVITMSKNRFVHNKIENYDC